MSLIWTSDLDAHGSYITFTPCRQSASGKTRLWLVRSETGVALGQICWFALWRKYTFQPVIEYLTTYEWVCLREIADFCEECTKRHKAAKI